jgi:hypothetical protein
MAYIARVAPMQFINLGSSVGDRQDDVNRDDDVFVVRAFMIYLQNFRKDLKFTKKSLPTVGGGVDATLLGMVADYKKFKQNAFEVLLDEKEALANRMIPQDEKLLRGAPRTTIMALNLDVRPLQGYGYSAVEVMCNLFPLKSRLEGLPVRPDATWQELARSGVPWDKWFSAQKQEAMRQRNTANERMGADPTQVHKRTTPPATGAPAMTREEAREILDLLQRYQGDMKAWFNNRVIVELTTSPNPSRHAQPVTFTARVRTVGGQIPAGKVSIYQVDHTLRRFHGPAAVEAMVERNKRPVVNGVASVTTEVFQGHHTFMADYFDTSGAFGARTSIEHDVTK